MHIDWTINAGNLLAFVGALIAAYIAISTRMSRMETKLDAVWDWFIAQMPQFEDQRRANDRFAAVRAAEALKAKRE